MKMDFFLKSFQKSIGSHYRESYSENELNTIAQKLFEVFEQKSSDIIYIEQYYELNELLHKKEIDSILILCKSIPFFTAKIRGLFYKLDLDIKNSIHFHPSPSHEMFYIEIKDIDDFQLKKVLFELELAYHKIKKYTQDYKQLTQENSFWWTGWEEIYKDLLAWLIHKGYIWEGMIFVDNKNLSNNYILGYPEKNSDFVDWFMQIPATNTTELFATESLEPAFLSEYELFYIALINQSQRLLLVGSLNQLAQYSGLLEIPVLNKRFQQFTSKENIQSYSGLGRTVRMLFNSIPTEVLFLIPESEYSNIYGSLIEQSLKNSNFSIGLILNSNLILIVSFIRETDWREDIWKKTNEYIQLTESVQSLKTYQIFKGKFIECFQLIRVKSNQSAFPIKEVTNYIERAFISWKNAVSVQWEKKSISDMALIDFEFHLNYQVVHAPEDTIRDILLFRELKNQTIVSRIETTNDMTYFHAITRENQFPLSQWVTALLCFQLEPISENVFEWEYQGNIYHKSEFGFKKFEDNNQLYFRLNEAIAHTMKGRLSADSLSSVLVQSKLDTNGILFLKSIRDYCLQTNPEFNSSEINEILIRYVQFCEESYNYFLNKFEKGTVLDASNLKILSDQTKTIHEDKVLNAFRTVVLSIVRTNFFGLKKKDLAVYGIIRVGIDRDAIAYKIDSSIPISLPDPRPFREIFVYSSNFQGIHLRGGKVARGGLRFSDRHSDYRTEVLSLMRTQMVKNSVIVPVGSKGGFIISKNSYTKNALTVIDAYRPYIHCLLELTDNRISGQDVLFAKEAGFAYDEFDPYLVVAADKGTSHLSDVANEISLKFCFWLSDAFASGGSQGYSHKKLGITAKGALVTCARQLRKQQIDFRNEPITCIGIGDMGGDVFGNGLLESKYIQLVAAFNHSHIFIDPNPDLDISYNERKRLFSTKDSNWNFYNQELLSKGGGIYNRNEKSILISKEAKAVLGISEDQLSGVELIRAILKAPVDLLYNGGIGTYIKSELEENSKVGDPQNNETRINGKEIRAKIVSEGGNLGCTQLGRIEFDLKGGLIYTDALDNSGGVDLSDHEVNLKLFFNHLKERSLIQSVDERNQFLDQLAPWVVESVLSHNSMQSLSIDVDCIESQKYGWTNYIKTTNLLIENKILNPTTEKIPSKTNEWEKWRFSSNKIPRPALCILLGYTKMALYNLFIKLNLFHPKDFEDIYLEYFPNVLVNKYKEELFLHPLCTEILNTKIVNTFVDFMGVNSYLLFQKSNSSQSISKIIHEFNRSKIYTIYKSLSLIDAKGYESEIVDLVSFLRGVYRKKWESGTEINQIILKKLEPVLSDEIHSFIQKLVGQNLNI